jgi:putative zinc finger protein
MTPDAQAERHLESGEVASYLDRALSPAEQAQVETHLADCAECRGEVIAVSRLRHTRSRPRWLILGPAVAAAAIALFLFARPAETPAPGTVLREGEEPPRATVALVAPAEGAAIPTRSPTFTWRSIGAGVSYRLTLTDERGDVVWTATSSDTTGHAPSDVRLQAGRQYFWYVDALLPDGRSVTSGARQFTARP